MSTPHRPIFITILTVLGILSAVTGLLLGVLVVVDREDADFLAQVNDSDLADGHQITANLLLTIGIIVIVVAAIQLVVAIGLGSGSPVARIIFALTVLGNAAGGLYGLVALHGEQQMSAAFTLTFSLFVLWYLFGAEDSRAFFHHGNEIPS